MKDLKLGHYVLKVPSHYYEWEMRITEVKIVKINKTTYKLSDGALIYKDGLGLRASYRGWSISYIESYYEKTDENIKELKERQAHYIKRRVDALVPAYEKDLKNMYPKALEIALNKLGYCKK